MLCADSIAKDCGRTPLGSNNGRERIRVLNIESATKTTRHDTTMTCRDRHVMTCRGDTTRHDTTTKPYNNKMSCRLSSLSRQHVAT